MYFRVEPTGCQEWKGLIQVRYDLHRDNSELQHVHFCQFELGVTDEEIRFVGKLALTLLKRDGSIRNLPIKFNLHPRNQRLCQARVKEIQKADLKGEI
jgi:hypothetical protein